MGEEAAIKWRPIATPTRHYHLPKSKQEQVKTNRITSAKSKIEIEQHMKQLHMGEQSTDTDNTPKVLKWDYSSRQDGQQI
jgi:hypothetical protein